ncbi:MAG: DUF3443 family protein [Burkholderiaceae bacterium]|nr:DUF3443 family protein [Burkholderiaceae bacterium]
MLHIRSMVKFPRQPLFTAFAVAACALLVQACGGSHSGSSSGTSNTSSTTATAGNSVTVTVNGGISSSASIPNMVMTSVTVCTPSNGTCATIPNIQVDTGSTGLRIMASVLNKYGLALPAVTPSASGHSYQECLAFADGTVWGSLATANMQMGSESASGIVVQVIQDSQDSASVTGPADPTACTNQGADESSIAQFGANGIIGVGLFIQDCGTSCAQSTSNNTYFDCTGTGSSAVCNSVRMPLAQQVSNPVASFAKDNNGVILKFAQIANTGVATATGTLTFGIGTQSNNGLGSSAVLLVPDTGPVLGDFTATFQSMALTGSFFDSGSGGLYFNDANIPVCTSKAALGYYCPGGASSSSSDLTQFSVPVAGTGSQTVNIAVQVENAQYLFSYSNTTNVFNNLAAQASSGLTSGTGTFDFGMPAFFGHTVYTGFENNANGPYFAYQ